MEPAGEIVDFTNIEKGTVLRIHDGDRCWDVVVGDLEEGEGGSLTITPEGGRAFIPPPAVWAGASLPDGGKWHTHPTP